MKLTRRLAFMLPLVAGAAAGALWWRNTRRAEIVGLENRLAAPVPPPSGPLAVFHLGHSLVNRDMPAMLAQLAGNGHRYESQLGWGTTLKAHWGDEPINGFDTENAHPRFRPAHEAVPALCVAPAIRQRRSGGFHQPCRAGDANERARFGAGSLSAGEHAHAARLRLRRGAHAAGRQPYCVEP